MDGGRSGEVEPTGDGGGDVTPPHGVPLPPLPDPATPPGGTPDAARDDIWDVGTAPPITPDQAGDQAPRAGSPALPATPAVPPPSMRDPFQRVTPGTGGWFRTDEERNRSVYRLANPWYRRATRGLIAVILVAGAGIGVYAGIRAIEDYVERDRLPAAGAEVPPIRATSFLIDAAAPAPELAGTLTIDATTRAFEYVGRPDGPQSGVHVVSADGQAVYLREAGAWRLATASDVIAGDVVTAVAYLADDRNADAVLTPDVRRGYAKLLTRAEEGTGIDRLTRYELSLDTRALAGNQPVQWTEFVDAAIPGAVISASLPVTIWVDESDVLVRVSEANWAWQRLTYSEQPFRVAPPEAAVGSCASGGVTWTTALASCDEAERIGRDLAAAAGLDVTDGPATDQVVADLCAAMAVGAGPLPATEETSALAAALVARGVCDGDPTIFVTGG